ncbi:hypothetical protein GCM10010193_08860 [Kitasatospora atroaurantiaca]
MTAPVFYRIPGDELPEPEPLTWALGRCFCCQRPNIVTAALTFDLRTGTGPATLPICPDCVGRAARQAHRAALRAKLANPGSHPT